ncbi:GerMN domain-containing protein [Streptomyces sp. MS1.HAVA.3]|uniref:GerMN domain-containing protein n=1 Tax=Streptomyces caledonius TaxID=3134107 RepID=A0ABU8U1B6_9ACTN
MTARRTRYRAATATAALVAGCALLLTGCGIKRSGVVDSGHAATVKVPNGKGAVFYFVSKEGDRLIPVPFPVDSGYTIAPTAIVRLLLEGPTGPSHAAGLTTALPRLPAAQTEAVAVSAYSPDDGITVRVPFAVGGLSELAHSQLMCTVGLSIAPDRPSPVTLQGTDTTLPSAECDTRR